MAIRIGLLGQNGHQLSAEQLACAAQVYACGVDPDRLPPGAILCDSVEELLASPADMLSICSPKRHAQHADIERALRAGKHVLAEKPAVMQAESLRCLIDLARQSGLLFAEMNPIFCEQPYAHMRGLITRGEIGQVVQVFAQKSYPYAPWRPADEAIDGGLILQNAIHALRMVEHVALRRILRVSALQSTLGSHGTNAGLVASCSLTLALEGGAVGAVTANYWNPPSTGAWGNEELRIFGERGLIQAASLGEDIAVYREEARIDAPAPAPQSFFAQFCTAIEQKKPLPLDAETAFHPTFAALAARESARHGGAWVDC